MRKAIFFLPAMFFALSLQAQWYLVNSGTTETVFDICFADNFTGYAAISNAILKTTDGGENWAVNFVSSSKSFRKVIILNDTVYANGGSNGSEYVFKSAINSAQWDSIPVPQSIKEWKISGSGIYLIGYNQDLLIRTDDYFTSFDTLLTVPGAIPLFDVNSSSLALIEKNSLKLYLSGNNGLAWSTKPVSSTALTPSSFSWADFRIFHDTILLKASYPGVTVVSTDTGNNWTTFQNPPVPGFTSCIVTSRVLYGFDNPYILYSNNSGETWEIQDTLDSQSSTDILGFFFLNKHYGFAYGKGGKIYKTTTGGKPAGIKKKELPDLKIKIYPIPSKDEVLIEWPRSLNVIEITMTDMNGRKLNLPQKVLNTISIKSLEPGNYLLSISTKEGIATQKIIIE